VDAVLPGVRALVNVTVGAAALEQILDHGGVLRAGGALEAVDMQAQGLPLLFELGGDDVAIVARRLSKALGRPLDVDPCSSEPVVRMASKPCMVLNIRTTSATMVV